MTYNRRRELDCSVKDSFHEKSTETKSHKNIVDERNRKSPDFNSYPGMTIIRDKCEDICQGINLKVL